MTNQADRESTGRPSTDRGLPGRLLVAERDELMPLLRVLPEDAFALRTCCPGWTVRHVLAHCAAALRRAIEGRLEKGAFTPEGNDRDIADLAHLSVPGLLDELERGMTGAGPAIAAAGGALDALSLGEWVHAGDVRDALGEPGAYGGQQLDMALEVLAVQSRVRRGPRLTARLDDGRGLQLGLEEEGEGGYRGDGPTLIRLYAGRPLTGTRYELTGLREADLVLFR
jgi:uncharacterized protein (TIGR03083 family)